jgi:ABC-type methionine transport system permease subunit
MVSDVRVLLSGKTGLFFFNGLICSNSFSHVEEGFIEAVSSSGDSNQQHFTLTEAVAESVELAMETPI